MWNSIPGKEEFAGSARREMLRSALMTAVCAGLPAATAATAQGVAPGGAMPAARAATRSGSLSKGMVAFTLSHEQFPVPELIRLGAAAENAGFDLVATSDHFQPWQADERHSGQAWVTLGALGQKTQRIWMGTAVTCPTLRYRPAVVAQAFATLSLLNPGRIFLGMGSGEALNEQAATGEWPKWRERWDRLIEAATVIRALWTGNDLHHKGTYCQVDGKLYDPPAQPIPLLLAANGRSKSFLTAASPSSTFIQVRPINGRSSTSTPEKCYRESGARRARTHSSGHERSNPLLHRQHIEVFGD